MVYEWLLSDEYDVCDHMLYLFLYLDCKELYGNVATICRFMWRWLVMYMCVTTICCLYCECCRWLYICYVEVNCWWLHIYKYWWCWGDYRLCEHMHWVESYVHAFMTDGGGFYIQDWWWRILYPIEVSTMFLLHRRWRPWGVLVPHASREESRTLHAFE
jgi:hypothetical protein